MKNINIKKKSLPILYVFNLGTILKTLSMSKNYKNTSIMSYGDTLAKINFDHSLTNHRRSKSLMSLVIAPIKNPFGIVKWNSKNKLISDTFFSLSNVDDCILS